MRERVWTIELTEDQLITIAEVLEFASRFHCGQIGTTYLPYATQELMWGKDDKDWKEASKRRDQFDTLGAIMKSVIHREMDTRSNSCYGVGFDKWSDDLYDMYKQIRYELHHQHQRDNPEQEETYSVHASRCKYGEGPDMNIKVKENDE